MTEPTFAPGEVLRALAEGGVEFVLVGGLAGVAHGSSYPTEDVDVCHSRERANLDRLATVLARLGARLRGAPADVPFLLDGATLAAGANFTFQTTIGSIDILGDPLGSAGYADLASRASVIEVAGQRVFVVALTDLIAMKEAAGRPKDLLMAGEYRAILEEQMPNDAS